MQIIFKFLIILNSDSQNLAHNPVLLTLNKRTKYHANKPLRTKNPMYLS